MNMNNHHYDMNDNMSLNGPNSSNNNNNGGGGGGGNSFLSSLRDNASEFYPSGVNEVSLNSNTNNNNGNGNGYYDSGSGNNGNNTNTGSGLFGVDGLFGRSTGSNNNNSNGNTGNGNGNNNQSGVGIDEGFQLAANALDGLHNYAEYSQFSNY